MAAQKRGLGRGLDALLGNMTETPSGETSAIGKDKLAQLPIEKISRGQYQPRRDFEPEALQELANSISSQGVMQPILVRAFGEAGRYEIIAGERRWRAAQLAGLDTIPAVIREVNDEAAMAMGLIENIQRQDLNAVEEAVALNRLQTEFGLTQQQVADAIGKSRATVANLLRLLSLSPPVSQMLENGDLEMGHARALLPLDEKQQLLAARQVVDRELSVRQTEALVKKLQNRMEHPKVPVRVDPDVARLERELSDQLGTSVVIRQGKNGKGEMVTRYNSNAKFGGILGHIK